MRIPGSVMISNTLVITVRKLKTPTTSKVVPIIKLIYLAAFKILTPNSSVSPGAGSSKVGA